VLFGTGARAGLTLSATIGGMDAPVLYSGPQGAFAGLDQVNIRIAHEPRGRGKADLLL
jgi:uncharacterized protein (TIGR03437 family)